ncbi:MAG TPA: molybdopterin-binding oxidoreductase [Bdellovibrionales bacterium]|nr:MAG: hypothetical protein A2Z97_11690 [Bdellovibrionales bacterium GWB1_52_6]OFZ05375.1 MAG: hypothetical protein A2X97_16660 [Bdellovibrionales bacterium GWA1_52_35]OFZ43083.1 MAG: hypothetical protein A2070_01620 [Bdellovibrionales bacterium GWC1_52_8]HAR43659.1 molybdopterin-binding oxidoreductase [Bdellovibrionales bacterium]HCM38981.1 molybdopterin-binding oxidoreductase [Bdellovibrionales bacterium]
MKDPIAREVHKRTRRSILAGLAGAVIGISGWKWLFSQERDEGLPWPLRRVLGLNETLASACYSNSRLTPQPPAPAPGSPIRINGPLGLESPVDFTQWSLRIAGPFEGEYEKEFSLDEIRKMPRTETTTELKCIEGWTERFSYSGVKFSDFLVQLGRPDRPAYVGFETPDGEYYVSLDMDSMLHPQTLLAYEMNGKPLLIAHGAPLRLLVPVKYGIKSLKRVGTITFSDERLPDYWAERGYDWYAGL